MVCLLWRENRKGSTERKQRQEREGGEGREGRGGGKAPNDRTHPSHCLRLACPTLTRLAPDLSGGGKPADLTQPPARCGSREGGG